MAGTATTQCTVKHLTSLADITPDDIVEILNVAGDLKSRCLRDERPSLLQNRVLAQIFEKPSLRTRNSFESAMAHLGGTGIFLSSSEAGLQGRESLADIARVLSSYADVIVLRTYSQQLIEDFAVHSACPVINGLSDERHPCQALTDLLTIRETLGELQGKTLAFIGDGNNIARSLALACAMTGMQMAVASPPGFELPEKWLAGIREQYPAAQIRQVGEPLAAVSDAHIVYTDVWASMGQENESDARVKAFTGYQVNAELMEAAPSECRFMHDLPAKRGLEVTDDVIDGRQSIVFRQAENRLHLSKGLFVWLIDR